MEKRTIDLLLPRAKENAEQLKAVSARICIPVEYLIFLGVLGILNMSDEELKGWYAEDMEELKNTGVLSFL